MIGGNIKEAREQSGLGQAELARAAGLDPRLLWRYESGRSNPSLETISRIAAALGTTIETLIEGAFADSSGA